MTPLLEIKDLHLEFKTFDGVAKVLAGIDLTMQRGDVLALVGETGCGKSMTALSVPRLIPMPPGKITQGQVLFKGEDLLKKSAADMQRFRSSNLGMIFQDPTTNLNPLFTIKEQLVDAVLYQRFEANKVPPKWRLSAAGRQMRKDAAKKSAELMHLVGIQDGDKRLSEYPHQFSGGMRQRVLIAMALAGEPELLIADEPTTALDVTIQAQILGLIRDLVKQLDLSVLLITHNLGVVAKTCEKVAVMYAGRVVESSSVNELFAHPKHPYTQGLLNAVPTKTTPRGGLEGIPGLIPNLTSPPQGCRFHPRCPSVMEPCRTIVPDASLVGAEHKAYCHLYETSPKVSV